jgi:sortase A
MPYAHFTYTVIGTAVVPPSDTAAAVDDVGYPRVVLSACTPLFSAAKRLLVYARLTSILPAGEAQPLLESPAPRASVASAGGAAATRGHPGLPAVLESGRRDLLPPLGQ